jgi:glutathione S-transferase
MMRLHHVPQSRSMRVLWLLNELGIPFDVVVHAFDRSLRSPDYLALHPVGRVPSLEFEDRVLWESGAIIEILCERFPEPALGRALEHPERIDWLIWVHFAESLSQHVAALTQQHLMLYEDRMRSPVVMRLEAKRIEKCYAAIDRRLQERTYLLDGGFSAADVAVGQAAYMARHFARTDAYAALMNWYDRITERPSFIASLPPEDGRLYTQDFYEAWDE